MRLFKLQMELKGQLPPPECAEELPKAGGEPGEAPKGLRCGGGRSSYNVTWDGELIPCVDLRRLGKSVLGIGFKAAWQEIHEKVENFLLPCECETCPYKPAAKMCAAAHQDTPGHAAPEQCRWCRAMVKAGLAKTK